MNCFINEYHGLCRYYCIFIDVFIESIYIILTAYSCNWAGR